MKDQLSILAQKLKEANDAHGQARKHWKETEDIMNQAYEDLQEASHEAAKARRELIDFVEQKRET